MLKTPQYQMLVEHALEIIMQPTGDGCDVVAGYVAQSHSQTITDLTEFRRDVRKAYLAAVSNHQTA